MTDTHTHIGRWARAASGAKNLPVPEAGYRNPQTHRYPHIPGCEISFSFRSQHSFVKFIDVWFHQLLEKTDLEADTNMSQENMVTGSRGVCPEGVFSPTELEQPV